MDRVGKHALELLRNGLLERLGDDRSVAAVLSVRLTTSTGAGIVNLGVLVRVFGMLAVTRTLLGRLSSRP